MNWIGHIITAILSLAGIVYSYATLKAEQTSLRKEFDKSEGRYLLKEVFEQRESALDERYAEILRRLDRIEGKLNGKS